MSKKAKKQRLAKLQEDVSKVVLGPSVELNDAEYERYLTLSGMACGFRPDLDRATVEDFIIRGMLTKASDEEIGSMVSRLIIPTGEDAEWEN